MRERNLPRAVDGPVRFVHDDDIEVAARVLLVAAHHGLQEAHGDLLLLPLHAGPQPVAWMTAQNVLQRRKSLFRELIAVDEKEDSLGAACVDEPLEIEGDQIRLSGAGRKLDQEPALAELDSSVERPHRILLIGTHGPRLALTNVVVWDRDGRERLPR